MDKNKEMEGEEEEERDIRGIGGRKSGGKVRGKMKGENRYRRKNGGIEH